MTGVDAEIRLKSRYSPDVSLRRWDRAPDDANDHSAAAGPFEKLVSVVVGIALLTYSR